MIVQQCCPSEKADVARMACVVHVSRVAVWLVWLMCLVVPVLFSRQRFRCCLSLKACVARVARVVRVAGVVVFCVACVARVACGSGIVLRGRFR